MTEKTDKFHAHEALHAAHIAIEMWCEHVEGAKWIEENKDLFDLAGKASDAMGAVYQAIGNSYDQE